MDVGGISLVVRIQGIVVVLAGRAQRRSLHVLIDLGSISNYLNTQYETVLELKVKSEEEFERLRLAGGEEVHAQGYVQFVLHCGNCKTRILAWVLSNLHEELILGIPWLVKENPTIDWAIGRVTVERDGTMYTLPCYR